MIEDKVLKYCIENKLIEKHERIVVGVSGGADSVCLLFILLQMKLVLKIEIIVVHVEHGLRGAESLLDAQFVKNICEVYELPFRQYSYDVKDLSRTWKISLEAAGRQVRYQAFAQAREEFAATKVAVAHHENDQAETILWNLVRGTGLKGLAGMSPVRDQVIRPLLCVSRAEIERYLAAKNIEYREDQTNHQNDYTRNKIRNVILPLMAQEMNTQVVPHLAEMGRLVQAADQFIAKAASQLYQQAAQQDGLEIRLDVDQLQQADYILQQYVVRLCIQELTNSLRDITANHVEQVIRLSSLQVGKQLYLPDGIRVYREYDGLVFRSSDERTNNSDQTSTSILSQREAGERRGVSDQDPSELSIPVANISGEAIVIPTQRIRFQDKIIEFEVDNYEMEIIPQKKCTMWLDYDKIRFSLKIRTRRPGDYLVINSQGDKKKLKNYFIDEKIPREAREHILLLAAGEQILWVIGYRKSAVFGVTGDTKTVLKIQLDGG